MSESRHIVRNITYSILGETGGQAIAVVQYIIAARYLGSQGVGMFWFALSTVMLAVSFMDLGTSTLATRDIARDHSCANTIMPRVAGLRLAMAALLVAALLAFSYTAMPARELGPALRLMCLMALAAAPAAYYGLFRSVERMDLAAVVNLGARIGGLAAVIAAVLLDAGLNGIVLAYVGYQFLALALIAAFLPNRFRPMRVSFDPAAWMRMARMGFPFLAMGILWEIFNQIDMLLIPYLDSLSGNGQYGAAMRLAIQFKVIPAAIGSFVFPYFTRRAVDSREPLKTGARMLYRLLTAYSLAVILFVGIPGRRWLILLFGPDFAPAANSLLILSACLPMISLNAVNMSMLYALDRQGFVLKALAAGVVLDIVLDLVLIPVMGFDGAAVATLATHAVFFAAVAVESHRAVPGLGAWKTLAGPCSAALGAGALMIAVRAWPLPAQLAAGLPAFVLLLAATRSLRRDDMRMLRDAARPAGLDDGDS